MSHAQFGLIPPGQTSVTAVSDKTRQTPVRVRWLLPLTFSIIVGLMAACFPAQAATSVVMGGVGNISSLSRAAGVAVPENRYARLNANPPNTRMINMTPNTNWATIAAAKPGSAVYNNLVRWGNTLKSRRAPIFLAFSHEPEAHASRSLGTASQFVAAFRKVVTVIRSTGASNVSFVWQMTSYAFQAPASDPRYAPKWYPGAAYVTDVGADPYNWYTCGAGKGRGQWLDLASVAAPALNFARAAGKGLVLPEYASQAGAGRAQWLRNAGAWARANSATVKGMFYFDVGPQGPSQGCNWVLSSAADLSAFGSIAR
jgi:hypothetical protein